MVVTGRSDLSLNICPVLKAALSLGPLKEFLLSLLFLRSYSLLSAAVSFLHKGGNWTVTLSIQLSFSSAMSTLAFLELQRIKFSLEQYCFLLLCLLMQLIFFPSET